MCELGCRNVYEKLARVPTSYIGLHRLRILLPVIGRATQIPFSRVGDGAAQCLAEASLGAGRRPRILDSLASTWRGRFAGRLLLPRLTSRTLPNARGGAEASSARHGPEAAGGAAWRGAHEPGVVRRSKGDAGTSPAQYRRRLPQPVPRSLHDAGNTLATPAILFPQ